MDSVIWLALFGAVALAAWWWARRSPGRSQRPEAELRRICFGNDAQAERLIQGEMARAPGITRAEAASRAVRRYQRDNR